MHRQFRKPLCLFFSKQLLRHPLAKSELKEFTGESHFEWIIEDRELGKSIHERDGISRVVLCSGQVYTALHKKRASLDNKNTAIIKLEQLHPFPFAQLRDTLNKYPNLEDLVYCQEEPLNMGAYSYVAPRMVTTLKQTDKYANLVLRYAGRDPSASVAAGSKAMHNAEEEAFLKEVFQEA